MALVQRFDMAFSNARQRGMPALIPFVMAGDGPTDAVLDALVAGGADMVELGMPFSDPMADGPVIQAAGRRALETGMTLAGVLEIAARFRARHAHIPLVLMGYYNPVLRMGPPAFCAAAGHAGVDGVILVDLPPEEAGEMVDPLRRHGVHMVRLVAPTSLHGRLPQLMADASGYIYYIAVTGITGAHGAAVADVAAAVAQIRTHTSLPVAVGFGIKTPADAAALRGVADAVVVGSALVAALAETPAEAPARAKEMMQAFRNSL